jgi:hypothetical protein
MDRRQAFLALAVFAGACTDAGRSGGDAPSDLATASAQGPGPSHLDMNPMNAPPDLAMPASTPYPPGPYGNQIGDTLGEISGAGYTATGAWSSSLRLSDLRNDPACKCILVTIGASWCGACQAEQPDLVSAVGSDPSFCVLGILQEGQTHDPATTSDLNAWQATFDQNFPVMLGTADTEQLLLGYGSSIGLPFAFIVNPSTMTILDNTQGYASDLYSYARSRCGY